MRKQDELDNKESSGLFLGSEPMTGVRYRSAAQDDDKTDKLGDGGDDDDSTDSDGTDSDMVDGDDSDSGDSDGKD